MIGIYIHNLLEKNLNPTFPEAKRFKMPLGEWP